MDSAEGAASFWKHTLYWHQVGSEMEGMARIAAEAIDWLVAARMVENHASVLAITPLGKATAHSGLLPTTAASFARTLAANMVALDDDFPDFVPAIIHWACSCEEFFGETPSRFLPYPGRGADNSTQKPGGPSGPQCLRWYSPIQ